MLAGVIVQSRDFRLRDQLGQTVGFPCRNGGVQKKCIENVADRNADPAEWLSGPAD